MSAFPHITGIRFTELLGQGGMAAVYAATETGLDREVAVKVVGSDDDSQHSQQRLENEARALAGLRHPHIIEVYRYGRTRDGALYYVMPRLRGGDLSTWRRPVDEERAVELLDALLDALGHAHAAGIVHRDIKPENILFDERQRPVLADFGAAQRPTGSRLTQEGMAIGSTGYMSPEQARGQVVDARSDLYSVGVLAFELLTGHLPYPGRDSLAIALAQAEQPVPRLPARLAHWQRFVDRALAFSPARRYRNAEEMRAALDEVDASRWNVNARASRHRLRGPLLAGFALLATLAAMLWWTGRPVATDPAQIDALIAAGAIVPPADPNALDLLVQPAARALPEWTALRARLLASLEAELHAALAAGDLAAARAPFERWQQAVAALDAQQSPQAGAMRSALDAAIADRLADALDRYDRAAAQPALQLLERLPQPVPETLQALAARAAQLRQEGERFADDGGPELMLVRRPADGDPGVAVMTAAVTPALYAQFVQATGRSQRDCASPGDVQGCIGFADARAFAGWLSERTGARYQLPERDELATVLDRIADAPAQAWTSTCRQVERVTQPNIAQRTWGGIRNVFGGERARAKVERHCDGQYALALDADAADATADGKATPRHTVVLVREVR